MGKMLHRVRILSTRVKHLPRARWEGSHRNMLGACWPASGRPFSTCPMFARHIHASSLSPLPHPSPFISFLFFFSSDSSYENKCDNCHSKSGLFQLPCLSLVPSISFRWHNFVRLCGRMKLCCMPAPHLLYSFIY